MAENTPVAPTTTTQIKTVQLGDPGVGLDLYLAEPITEEKSLWITLSVTDVGDKKHHSDLIINGPITESPLIIVMPYGCENYVTGTSIEIEIQCALVYMENNEKKRLEILTYKGSHVSQDGQFNFSIKRSFLASLLVNMQDFDIKKNKRRASVLLAGESLYSENDRYCCRLEYDGRLAIYDLADPRSGTPIYESELFSSNFGKGKYYAVLSQIGNLQILGDNNGADAVKWSASNQADKKGITYPKDTSYVKLTNEGKLIRYRGANPRESSNETPLFDITNLMVKRL
jgi:hypothetical protein